MEKGISFSYYICKTFIHIFICTQKYLYTMHGIESNVYGRVGCGKCFGHE